MQIKQLEYLLKTVECGSITKASQQMFVSQPSLTKAIMNLEEEFGIQILVRKARGVVLTPEGKKFVRYARSVLTAVHALERNVIDPPEVDGSRLFVAAQQLDFIYRLFLDVYQENKHKNIHYSLIETDRNQVTRLVLDRKADLGLLVRSNNDAKTFLWHTDASRLQIDVIDRAPVYACVGPHCPYYDRSSITFSEAEAIPHIVLDMEDAAREDLYIDVSRHHFNTQKIVFFNTVAACEQFLLETDSMLYTAKWATGCFRDPRIRILPVLLDEGDDLQFENELLLIRRVNDPIDSTEAQFIQRLYDHFSE